MTPQQKNKRDLTLRFFSGVASPLAVGLLLLFMHLWLKARESDKVDKAEMKQFMRETHVRVDQLEHEVQELQKHDQYLTEHGVFIGRPLTYSRNGTSSGGSAAWK